MKELLLPLNEREKTQPMPSQEFCTDQRDDDRESR